MTCLKLVKAGLARGLFVIHSFVTVWRVVNTKSDSSYWLLGAGILILIFEGIVSICSRHGEEMKWFCPSVFFYLLSIVPPIWILELDLAAERLGIQRENSKVENGFANLFNFTVNISLPREMWTKVLEQILMVMLIIGRWLLPKGNLSRDQLSQLLLVYIGMAADIVELFEAFKEEAVLKNIELTYAILGIWSWSLIQFTLVLSASHGRKTRLGNDNSDESEEERQTAKSAENEEEEDEDCTKFLNIVDINVIAIVTTVVFQDGPFLLLRMILIFHYGVVSYLNVFFTCKNTLVAFLQLYRLSVLCVKMRNKRALLIRTLDDSYPVPTGLDGESQSDGASIAGSALNEEVIQDDASPVSNETDWSRPVRGSRQDLSQPKYAASTCFTNMKGKTKQVVTEVAPAFSESDLSDFQDSHNSTGNPLDSGVLKSKSLRNLRGTDSLDRLPRRHSEVNITSLPPWKKGVVVHTPPSVESSSDSGHFSLHVQGELRKYAVMKSALQRRKEFQSGMLSSDDYRTTVWVDQHMIDEREETYESLV